MRADFATGQKICSHCRVPKPISEFTACHGKCDGLKGQCRECSSAYRRKVYPFRRERLRVLGNGYYARCRKDWKRWFEAGGYPPLNQKMHYHHIDPKSKLFAIGDFVKGNNCSSKNIIRIVMELRKCEYIPCRDHALIHNQKPAAMPQVAPAGQPSTPHSRIAAPHSRIAARHGGRHEDCD